MVFSGGVAWIFQVLVLSTEALCFYLFYVFAAGETCAPVFTVGY
jgi:hypothetical protein